MNRRRFPAIAPRQRHRINLVMANPGDCRLIGRVLCKTCGKPLAEVFHCTIDTANGPIASPHGPVAAVSVLDRWGWASAEDRGRWSDVGWLMLEGDDVPDSIEAKCTTGHDRTLATSLLRRLAQQGLRDATPLPTRRA